MTMKNILSKKVLVAIVSIANLFLCSTFMYILIIRPAVPSADLTPDSAVLTIIPGPTSTPQPKPTLTLLPSAFSPTLTPAPGQISIGVYVQPATGGEGLRIHTAPSLNADLAFPSAAFDSEVFLVTKGPEYADGYTWWYLTASYDTSRAGWAVQDFLTVIPSP